MIVEIEREKPIKNKYGRYFLSFEAPGDEVGVAEQDVTPTPKRNTKIINIKPRKSRLNFADGAEDDDPEDEQDPYNSPDIVNNDSNGWTTTPIANEQNGQSVIPENNPQPIQTDQNMVANPINTSNMPVSMDNPQPATTEPTVSTVDTMNPIQPDTGQTDNTDFSVGSDTDDTEDTNLDSNNPQADQGSPQPAEGGEQPMDDSSGPDTGGEGEDDFSAGAEDTDEEDMNSDLDASSGMDSEKKGPGLEYDSTRKYILFQNFMSLLNGIDNYVERLEGYMNDDYEMNKVIKIVIDKLRELRELTYDYLTMKFEISTYIQSLLFYQNQVVMVQLTFNILEKGQKISKKTKESKK